MVDHDRPNDAPVQTTPWSGRDILLAFLAGAGVGLALVVITAVAMAVLQVELSVAGQTALFTFMVYASTFAAVWYFALKRHRAPWDAIGMRNPGWGPLLVMIPLALLLMIVNLLILSLISVLMGEFTNPQREAFAPGGVMTNEDFAFLFVTVAVMAPIAEEVFFRGMFYRYLRKRFRVAAAAVVSAILFAAAHATPILLAPMIVLGIALALVVERYESLYPAILLHALNNGIAISAIYAVSSRG